MYEVVRSVKCDKNFIEIKKDSSDCCLNVIRMEFIFTQRIYKSLQYFLKFYFLRSSLIYVAQPWKSLRSCIGVQY